MPASAAAPVQVAVYIDCPACEGSGIRTSCANDGRTGCSHQHDREYPCAACDGDGEVRQTDTQRDDWCDDCGLPSGPGLVSSGCRTCS